MDERGNQIAVFGRVGARPLNWEQQRMYLRGGRLWTVSDDPFDRGYRFPGAIKDAFDRRYGLAPERVRLR